MNDETTAPTVDGWLKIMKAESDLLSSSDLLLVIYLAAMHDRGMEEVPIEEASDYLGMDNDELRRSADRITSMCRQVYSGYGAKLPVLPVCSAGQTLALPLLSDLEGFNASTSV